MPEPYALDVKVENEGARGDDAGGGSQWRQFIHLCSTFDYSLGQDGYITHMLKILLERKPKRRKT
jgi:hypothetical protein